MFEQAELRSTQMGPNGPPNATGTAQIAPEIDIPENRAFGDVTETAIWPFWPAISEPGWPRRKKVPLGVLLRSTRPSHGRVCRSLYPPEARQKFRRPGLLCSA